jgi:hypothetical protein
MLHYQGQASKVVKLLSPISAANTAAATSPWVDVREAEGDIVFISELGALTGSIAWTIEHATDGTGTNATAITPNEGAFAAGAANTVQKRTIPASVAFVRCIGTIVTGPALVGVTMLYTPKWTT